MKERRKVRDGAVSIAVLSMVAALCAALAGCGDEPDSPLDRARRAQGEREAQSRVEPGRVLPERGQARVEYVDGLVTIFSNQAPLSGILSELASDADFSLTLGDEPLGNVSLQIERLALTEALPDIMAGVPYGAEFATEEITGQRRVIHLWIGDEPPPGVAEAERERIDARLDERLADRLRSREEPRSREERMRARAERVARREEEQRRALDQLRSRDPAVRADAASEIDPEGAGLDALLDLVYQDPDPTVRIAAVSQLEDSDTHAAVEGLISALSDDDRGVVLEAIDALEFAGDETVIPRLEPFLDSPDPEVREAAAEAIEFLE